MLVKSMTTDGGEIFISACGALSECLRIQVPPGIDLHIQRRELRELLPHLIQFVETKSLELPPSASPVEGNPFSDLPLVPPPHVKG